MRALIDSIGIAILVLSSAACNSALATDGQRAGPGSTGGSGSLEVLAPVPKPVLDLSCAGATEKGVKLKPFDPAESAKAKIKESSRKVITLRTEQDTSDGERDKAVYNSWACVVQHKFADETFSTFCPAAKNRRDVSVGQPVVGSDDRDSWINGSLTYLTQWKRIDYDFLTGEGAVVDAIMAGLAKECDDIKADAETEVTLACCQLDHEVKKGNNLPSETAL